MNQAASEMALNVYVEMSDWALKSSGMDTSSPVSLPCACLSRSPEEPVLQPLLSKVGELQRFTGSKSKAVAEWLSQTPSQSRPQPPHACLWCCPGTRSCADGGALFLSPAFEKGMAGPSSAAHAASPPLWSAVIHTGTCCLPCPSDLLLVAP